MKFKKIIVVLSILLFNISFSQDNLKSNQDLEQRFIEEVFGANINKDSQHYKNLLMLLRERVLFSNVVLDQDEKFPKLSQQPLFNKYNEEITRDTNFDHSSFNVLKYDLNFFSPHTKVYRIDNTDWLIIIHPNL
jgi:hypothetical protein